MTEDRAISLNAVIKAVDKHTNDDGTLDDDITCILEDVPSVTPQESEDCRDCKKWEDCLCGKEGHKSGTSQGYSIGECKDFEPQESEEV